MCVIHEKLWCLGRSVTTGKRSVFEKGEGDLGNYGLVRLSSVTREFSEGIHWRLFPNTQRTRKYIGNDRHRFAKGKVCLKAPISFYKD